MHDVDKEIFIRLKSDKWDEFICRKVFLKKNEKKSDFKNLLLSILAMIFITTSYIGTCKFSDNSSENKLKRIVRENSKSLFIKGP